MKVKSEREVAQSCPNQQPLGLQPTRLLCPWDFPGNSTGVGSIAFSAILTFSSVQLLSRVRLFATPWIAAGQASLTITNSWSLRKLMSIESVMPSSHLILCSPLLLPSILPRIKIFSNESVLASGGQSTGVSAPTSVLPMYIQDWISYSINWLDLLAVQVILKNLLQPQFININSLVLSFFMVQLSYLYLTIGKTTALTSRTSVGKVMSLLFNMLSRLVLTFLPRSKRLLISWLQSHLQWFRSPEK